MLTQLTIKNFGLIDHLSLDFDDQLNIMTGETGAGKSIVIDALRIVLGDRISSSQLRDAKKTCIIEAVFESLSQDLKNAEFLQDFLSDDETSLIIQRTYQPEGRNKIKINGLSVTVSQLKEIGNYLIDFHGAHDHQMLLSSDSHIGMLDRVVDFQELLESYQKIYKDYSQQKKKLNELQNLASSRERDLDLLTHQVKELEQVSLDEKEYEKLREEQIKINNAEKLNECITQLNVHLDGDSQSLSENIRQAFSSMHTLNQVDESTEKFANHLNQIQEISEELLIDLRDYAEGLSFEPEHAQDVYNRCEIFDNIKRKYGPTLEDAKAFYLEAKEKYETLTDLESNDADVQKKLTALSGKLKTAAKELTKQRQKAAKSLKKTIEKELSELGMPHIQFEVHIESMDFGLQGADQVTFFISPNAGIELKPLAEIVSSGEAARVMLALKKALVKVDPVDVLIFDEIDAQIGGRLGTITGEKLQEISCDRQVILITHLPQIASFANAHFKVIKSVKGGLATTEVSLLKDKERVQEIAKMMSGEKESKIAVKHAHDLLAKAGLST